MLQKNFSEKIIEKVIFTSALTAILAVFLIILFVFQKGLPAIQEVGLTNFLLGKDWLPSSNVFGIFPMIIGSIYVTLGALIFSIPLAVLCALFLAEFAPTKIGRIVRSGIELLAGIPSVVYGFFGMIVIVPLISRVFGGFGYSSLAGSVILAIMILPTIISVAEDAINAVPPAYKEGSLALGATHWQTITKVILPAASSGILAGVVLGMGRALGETMAVIMVIGNAAKLPGSFLEPVRTLTANIAMEMAYSSGLHREALFATGVVLLLMVMSLNITLTLIMKRRVLAR
ncbi:phosphate ABC transporter permease subunit PstC [Bacillota bacterium LX-D]|nr:phosphate ABC transporter permease subunit PstC [Bacillota bacterium LX-D]